MNITFDCINENIDDVSVRLVYEAMLDKKITQDNMDGLTLDEVRGILERHGVNRIFVDGEVVGVFNPGHVHISCYMEWGLQRNVGYGRIGFVYIDKPHRNKGYATEIMKEHIKNYENYAECCHEDNIESNAMLKKVLKFHKRAWIINRREWFNVYIKTNA